MKLRLILNAAICIAVALVALACNNAAPPGTNEPNGTESGLSSNDAAAGLVSAEGSLVPHKKAALSFKTSGRIQQILVTASQTVTAGQELARLDTSEQEQAVRRAEASLQASQAQLEKAKAGARQEDVAMAEADVKIAEAGVASAEAAVNVARDTFTSTQTKVNTARASLAQVRAGPTKAQREEAAAGVALAEAGVRQAQAGYNQVAGDPKVGLLPEALKLEQATVELSRAKSAYQVVINGSTPEQIAIAESQVAEAVAGAKVAETQVTQTQSQVATAKAQLEVAQAKLALVKAGNRKEDIAVAESQVVQAEVGLADAKRALDDAVLRAPFGGVIGEVLINEGELVGPQVSAFRLGDVGQLSVETSDLSEVDVNRISVGQEVAVRVDALDGKVLRGRVTRIAPVASEHRGDKVYTVTIELEPGQTEGLRWGMTAYADIQPR